MFQLFFGLFLFFLCKFARYKSNGAVHTGITVWAKRIYAAIHFEGVMYVIP